MSKRPTPQEQLKTHSTTFFKILKEESSEAILLKYWKGVDKLVATNPSEVQPELLDAMFKQLASSQKLHSMLNLSRAMLLSVAPLPVFAEKFLAFLIELSTDFQENKHFLSEMVLFTFAEQTQLTSQRADYLFILKKLVHSDVHEFLVRFDFTFLTEKFREEQNFFVFLIRFLIEAKLLTEAFDLTGLLCKSRKSDVFTKVWEEADVSGFSILETKKFVAMLRKLPDAESLGLCLKQIRILQTAKLLPLCRDLVAAHPYNSVELLLLRTDSMSTDDIAILSSSLNTSIVIPKVINLVLFLKGKSALSPTKTTQIDSLPMKTELSSLSSTSLANLALFLDTCVLSQTEGSLSCCSANLSSLVDCLSAIDFTALNLECSTLLYFILTSIFLFDPQNADSLSKIISHIQSHTSFAVQQDLFYPLLVHFFTTLYIATDSALTYSFLSFFKNIALKNESALSMFNKFVPPVYKKVKDKSKLLAFYADLCLKYSSGRQTEVFFKFLTKNIKENKPDSLENMHSLIYFIQKNDGSLFSYIADYVTNGFTAAFEEFSEKGESSNLASFSFYSAAASVIYKNEDFTNLNNFIRKVGKYTLFKLINAISSKIDTAKSLKNTRFDGKNTAFDLILLCSLSEILKTSLQIEISSKNLSPMKANSSQEVKIFFEFMESFEDLINTSKRPENAVIINILLGNKEILAFFLNEASLFSALQRIFEDRENRSTPEELTALIRKEKNRNLSVFALKFPMLCEELILTSIDYEVKGISHFIVRSGLSVPKTNILIDQNVLPTETFLYSFLKDYGECNHVPAEIHRVLLRKDVRFALTLIQETLNTSKIALSLYSFVREHATNKEKQDFVNVLVNFSRDRDTAELAFNLLASQNCFNKVFCPENVAEMALLTVNCLKTFSLSEDSFDKISKVFSNLEHAVKGREIHLIVCFIHVLSEQIALSEGKDIDLKLCLKIKEKLLDKILVNAVKQVEESGVSYTEIAKMADKLKKTADSLGIRAEMKDTLLQVSKITEGKEIGVILEGNTEIVEEIGSIQLRTDILKYLLREISPNSAEFKLVSRILLGSCPVEREIKQAVGDILHSSLVRALKLEKVVEAAFKEHPTEYLASLRR